MSIIDWLIAVVLLLPLFWLLSRIIGVWKETKSAPPLSFLVRGYEINERNFPALGTGICCLICAWELITVTNWVVGFSASSLLFVPIVLASLLAVVGVVFVLIAISIAWFGRPRIVIPPAQRSS